MKDTRGISVFATDRKGLIRDITTVIAGQDANITYIQQFLMEEEVQIYLELEEIGDKEKLKEKLEGVESVVEVELYRTFAEIYGKRIIVIGGGGPGFPGGAGGGERGGQAQPARGKDQR